MDIFKTLELMVVLFVATCAFCWLLTSNWLFGPIVSIVAFIGGIGGLGLLGLFILEHE